LSDGLFERGFDFVDVPCQGLGRHHASAALVCGQGLLSLWLGVEQAVQGNGLAKVQPVAQFLPNIFRDLDSIEHGVFGQKTHKLGTVEVGTRQGSRHGCVGLESNGKAGRFQEAWAVCPRQVTVLQAEGVCRSGQGPLEAAIFTGEILPADRATQGANASTKVR
jgi:hypothetical protein